jgi:protein-S-isoprenylcysteine O-methyltransferase Ste14
MFTSHLLLALAWTGYCTLHSILADQGVKLFIRRRIGASFTYYRTFYNLFAFVLLALLIIWQLKIPTKRIWQPFYPLYILGGMMTIAGVTGMGIILKKYFITSNGFKDLFYEGGTPVLVTDGLHKFVRHPLYLGTFLFLWGLLLLIPIWSLLVVNMVITIYTLIGIHLEEKKLISIFGEQYLDYRKKVPMIWPFMRK